MQTQQSTAASADAGSPLRQLLESAPQAESISVDFKKGTWAFKPAAWYQVGAGKYLIVPLAVANMAMASEAKASSGKVTLAQSKFRSASYRAISNQPAIQIHFESGATDTYYRDLQPGVHALRNWNAAHWHGSRQMVDQQGNVWQGASKTYVTDNFCKLVEVQA